MDAATPNRFVITITGDEHGNLTAHDSRSGETENWDGVAIILGSVKENKFAPFFWGEYSSIVYGLYGSIMSARHEEGPVGEHHRNILGRYPGGAETGNGVVLFRRRIEKDTGGAFVNSVVNLIGE